MNKSDLIKLLDRAISLCKGTRIQRIRRSPIKLLYSKFLELICLWFDRPVRIRAKTFWKEDMFVTIPEMVSLSIYRYGFYEENLSKMILEYLKFGMTFFDIGSHFGYFTLLSSVLVGNKGRVYSFEPTPSSFNILKANVLNKDNVFLNNCAVFSKKKKVLMNDYGIKYSARNSIYNARLSKDIRSRLKTKKYEVECISIDNYVEQNDIMPNFIKIDAESSEYEILRGMEKTITKFHPMISLEVDDLELEGVPSTRDLINFLINKNYKPFEFKDGKIMQHIIKTEPYQHNNILFLPKSIR